MRKLAPLALATLTTCALGAETPPPAPWAPGTTYLTRTDVWVELDGETPDPVAVSRPGAMPVRETYEVQREVRIPSSEFFTPFPPDRKFGYRRDTHKTPAHFIRAYRLRDRKTGKDGPWLAGLTLEPSVVYEAWCSQRPGGIIIMIEEIHGRPVKAGRSFSAAHVVGYFDSIEEMHRVNDRYRGHTRLTAGANGWRLLK